MRRPIAEVEQLDLEPESYGMIFMGLGYHDTYFEPETGWPIIDHRLLLVELKEGLAPGRVLAIIDHAGLSRAEIRSRWRPRST